MISRLHGTLLEKHPPHVLLDVNGVGYDVALPLNSLFALPEAGETITLHIHFVVREDAQLLYGFLELRERELFRTLIKINGVGPKMALAIMSGMDVDELLRHVRNDNVKALSQIPGVGKKTAERLLVELRDKLAVWQATAGGAEKTTRHSAAVDPASEAEDALIALGYKPAEASKLVAAARSAQPEADSSALIRQALKSAISG